MGWKQTIHTAVLLLPCIMHQSHELTPAAMARTIVSRDPHLGLVFRFHVNPEASAPHDLDRLSSQEHPTKPNSSISNERPRVPRSGGRPSCFPLKPSKRGNLKNKAHPYMGREAIPYSPRNKPQELILGFSRDIPNGLYWVGGSMR